MAQFEILNNLAIKKLFLPSITGFNRLEPRVRTVDFSRSLRAEVRDPLWMLTRQWQMGEFKGEDSGSAVYTKVLTETERLNRYAVQDGKAVAFENDIPLETKVEREPLLPKLTAATLGADEDITENLAIIVQLGRYYLNLMNVAFTKGTIGSDYASEIKLHYPLALPKDPVHQLHWNAHPETMLLWNSTRSKIPDGVALLRDISLGVTLKFTVSAADKTAVGKINQAFSDWYYRLYNQPMPKESTPWQSSYLEYQFECSASAPAVSQTVLGAEQYSNGHLDWYAFDIEDQQSLQDGDGVTITELPVMKKLLSFIPTSISFGGMPAPRYWEMEDRQTEFADIDANTTDVSKMLLTEFALIYGNDWSLVPFDLEVGSICSIKGIVTKDVFEEYTWILPAGTGPDDSWQQWRMYTLASTASDQADQRLVLLPVIGQMQQSADLEIVNLTRDEIANMVWGVEDGITMPDGLPRDGYEAALELSNYNKSVNPPPPLPPLKKDDALIKYILGTEVPDNWIPFLPVHVDASNRAIQLQRARMPEAIAAYRTTILEGDDPDQPYFIHEEEVPRAGAIVTKAFQRTRWWNGRTYLWLGRRKQTGRGEGASGLAFDIVEDK
jgi:hypothetical protein